MKYRNKVLLALTIISLLRIIYIVYTPFHLSPDEAHYWEWSRRLDLSYYSKGPFIAYVIAVFTGIFGSTELAVRLGAVIFSALASFVLYHLGRALSGSERTGFYSALLPAIIPLFAIGSILMTTDVLFVFFWALSVYLIITALRTRSAGWWYVAGLSIGIGFLSKYTMVLIYPATFLFLLVSERDRFWLKRPAPYLASVISAIAASPVLIWNLRNGGVTFKHTMGQAHLGSASFSVAEPFGFFASQLGLITPIIFMGLAYGIWRCWRSGRKEKKSVQLYFFFASAFLFFFFLFKGFHGKVQANWAVASYVTALPASIWAFRAAYKKSGSKGRRLLAAAAAAGIFMGALGTTVVYCPWLLEPLGAKKILWGPPYNRVTGWTELGQKVSEVKGEMDSRSGARTFIMSDTYQITSELAFYTLGRPVTYNVDTGSRRMNQYDLWGGFEGLKGFDAIYVKGGDAPAEAMVVGAFEGCKKEIFPVYYKGRVLKRFTIFRCLGFKGMKKGAGRQKGF
ncbi:MAG: glycosyltransferase family 39 protein [Thermodesulfobacteriota bacterium]